MHGCLGSILLSGIEEDVWKDYLWAFLGTLNHIQWYRLLSDRHWRAPAPCRSLCSFDPEHSDTHNLSQTLPWRKTLLHSYQRMTRQNTLPGWEVSGERNSSSYIYLCLEAYGHLSCSSFLKWSLFSIPTPRKWTSVFPLLDWILDSWLASAEVASAANVL